MNDLLILLHTFFTILFTVDKLRCINFSWIKILLNGCDLFSIKAFDNMSKMTIWWDFEFIVAAESISQESEHEINIKKKKSPMQNQNL